MIKLHPASQAAAYTAGRVDETSEINVDRNSSRLLAGRCPGRYPAFTF
jgi:hypothetical protein